VIPGLSAHATLGACCLMRIPTIGERNVMSLVISGILQIAGKFGAIETTVKMLRSQVMKKMLAKSLPDLVRMADKLKSIT
jgi:FixJ family two-component response regulator